MLERFEKSEIPLPSNKLFLIDLDKTLIDASYHATDDRLVPEVQRVQSLGWSLGLSSDTPLDALKIWRKKTFRRVAVIYKFNPHQLGPQKEISASIIYAQYQTHGVITPQLSEVKVEVKLELKILENNHPALEDFNTLIHSLV
jgi:hypothetical protein